MLWVYFFPSTVPHRDAVTAKALLPSRAFKIHQPSAASFHFLYFFFFLICIIEEHFDLCSLFLFVWPNSIWLWQFLFTPSLPDLWHSCLWWAALPFLTYTLLSPKNPFSDDILFPFRSGLIPLRSPLLCLELISTNFFYLCHTDILSFFQVSSWALPSSWLPCQVL